MEELLLIARREFTELPRSKRRSPARIRNVQLRFYIERYAEHEQALRLLAEQPRGEGPKLIVRAILHYRDSITKPLEALKAGADVPADLRVGVLDFAPLSPPGNRVKAVGMRLYIDRYVEHREVAEFLQDLQQQGRDANKICIRALIHYRDTVALPLQRRGRRK